MPPCLGILRPKHTSLGMSQIHATSLIMHLEVRNEEKLIRSGEMRVLFPDHSKYTDFQGDLELC